MLLSITYWLHLLLYHCLQWCKRVTLPQVYRCMCLWNRLPYVPYWCDARCCNNLRLSLFLQGIPIFYFVGNHDLWMNGYFENELNIPVYHKPQQFKINSTTFFIGHGDGLGPGDKGYKRMKKLFTNRIAQWCFRWLHPDLGVKLAQYFSINNKLISGEEDIHFLGEDKEWLVQYSLRKLKETHCDYFVFGHRHLPLEITLFAIAIYFTNYFQM